MREKEPAPKSLKTYTNIEGRAKLTIQCQNTKILNNFDTFFINRYEESIKNLNEASNWIKINAHELAKSIQKFGESLDSLSELFSECGFDNNMQLYSDIKNLSKAYEDSVIEQAEAIIKPLDVPMKFHLMETNSIREFHKNKEDVYREFHKMGNDLHSKKNKLWEEREKPETHSKWQLNSQDFKNIKNLLENEHEARSKMLPKETHASWDKNNQFKHLQRRSVEEIQRCNTVFGNKLQEKFNLIAQDQLKIINR